VRLNLLSSDFFPLWSGQRGEDISLFFGPSGGGERSSLSRVSDDSGFVFALFVACQPLRDEGKANESGSTRRLVFKRNPRKRVKKKNGRRRVRVGVAPCHDRGVG
jgi:hypothetical protein